MPLIALAPLRRCRGPDDLTIHDAPACPPSAVPLDRVLIGLITGLSPTSQLGCIPGLIVARMGPDCRKAQEHPSPLQLPGGALHLRPLWIPLANAVPVSCTVLGQKGRCRLTPQSGCIPQLVVTRMGQACRKAREHPSVLPPPGAAHELHSDSCCEPAHPCCAFGSITPFSSFGLRLPFPCGLSLAGATDGPCCVEDHLPRLCGHCCARQRPFPTVDIGFRSLPGAELPPTWTATVPCCGGVQLPAGRCSCHCCALGMPSLTPPVGFRTSSSLDGLCWPCATHCSDPVGAPPRAGRHDHPRCNFVPSSCCAPGPGPAMTDRWPSTDSTAGLHTRADCSKDGSRLPQDTRTSLIATTAWWSAAPEPSMGSACQCRAFGLHNAWAEWLLLTASTIGLHTPADCDKDGSSMPQGTRTSPSVATARRSAAHELLSDSCLEPSMSSLFRTGLLGDGSSGCRDFTDGLHTQPFCRDGGASRPKGPSKSPDAADVCRSAVWPLCLGKAGPTPGGLPAAYRAGLPCLPGCC